MLATINLVAPIPGPIVTTPVVVFNYEVTNIMLGICNIEYSLDGVNFISVKEGEDNEDICRSDFFPSLGTFNIHLTHGSYIIHLRAVDCLNGIGPEITLPLIVDISTYVDFSPIPPMLVNNSTLVVGGNKEYDATVTVQIGTVFFPVIYPSSTTWSSTIVLNEGINVIVATATDPGMHQATATVTVTLDTLAPAAPVVMHINPAAPNYYDMGSPPVTTNIINQTFVGDKESNTALWINGVEIVPLNPSNEFTIPITLIEGANQFHIQTKDEVGNFSTETIVDILLDTIPPSGSGILINDGLEFTLNRHVTLTLTATDAVAVKVSENPSFPNVDYVPFTTSPLYLPFELSRGGGLKTVYAVFKDTIGNETVPVFDSIVLPSTMSTEIDRADIMTVQALHATPEDEYLIRLQDNRDGTYIVELYLNLIDALNGGSTNRSASVTSSSPGHQTLTLIPDIGGPTGTIELTFIEGGEMIIYRYRTDVYEADDGDSTLPIYYSIVDVGDEFEAQTIVPLYEGSAFGRILEYAVGGDKTKMRVSKSFRMYDLNTAVLGGGDAYNIVDTDGDLYPIAGAKFDYPLLTIPVEIIDIEEENDDYLVTLDQEIDRFDATFGYEILFSRRRGSVTDYRITKGGRVEFIDESKEASGNVRITYKSPQYISSSPSPEFKAISAAIGASVKLIIEPTNNLILLSDLDKISVRFFHSLVDVGLTGPSSIDIVINDVYSITISDYNIVNRNARAQIREFVMQLVDLFPSGTPGPDNPVIQKVDIVFVPTANVTYTDEIEVVAKSSVISSNCRVVVNGQEVYFDKNPVTNRFDLYELRVQNGFVDVLCNDRLMHSEGVNLISNATASFGAGARVNGDRLNAAFQEFDIIQYIDASPTSLALNGRYTEIEATLRESSSPLLRDFEIDFESISPLYTSRLYTPDILTDEFLDVSTVAVIGMGRREEVLVVQGAGLEDEGEPVDFDIHNRPDGRHFKVKSLPVSTNTLVVTLMHNGIEMQLVENINYNVNLASGQIVLFHPIALSDRLSVTYTSEADTNIPELFTSIDNLIVKFGTPSIENTLSLGAQIAFENGAERVLAVQALDPTLDPNWQKAYQSLVKEEAYFIVPLPPNNYQLVAAEGLKHVEDQSLTRNRHERVLILGETPDLTEEDLSLFRNTFRITFIQPSQLRRVISGETAYLNGMFLAAAYAGKFSSLISPAEPMTGKMLSGFDISWQPKLTNIEFEQKVSDGITYIKTLIAGGQVYRGVTTTNSGLAVEQEPSVVRIRDYLAINIRSILESKFIGQPIVDGITKAIENTTKAFLSMQKDSHIITDFINVRAKIDSVEPRQINVEFDVQPVFPLNTIIITVRVVASI